jgi:hypothetical protein
MASSSKLSPAERVLRARAAAYSQHAQGRTNTEPARRALDAQFAAQVDPDGTLDPVTRARRVEQARRAHMAKLALKSAKARRDRKVS